MKITASIQGDYLVDKSTKELRNYFNAGLTIVDDKGNELLCAHLIAYATSRSTLNSRVMYKLHPNSHALAVEVNKKGVEKLKRDRVRQENLLETFAGDKANLLDAIETYLRQGKYKISMKNAKIFIKNIDDKLASIMKLKGVSFEEKITERIADIDDPVKKEKAKGIGEKTAKTNPNWGMF